MATDTALWLATLRRYTLASALGHIAWETFQLPLYTIWFESTPSQIALAVVHCTVGDMLIASAAIFAALIAFGHEWPTKRTTYRNVALAAILLGAVATVFSEWLNVNLWRTWAYSPWMPQVPLLGIGLSPLIQWLVVPPMAFLWARGSR